MNLLLTLAILAANAGDSTIKPSFGQRIAPWASLLLPGTGELLRGYPVKGEIFLWADGAAVTGAIGFGWDAASKADAARTMAVMYAGANPLNSSRTYLSAIESYRSSDDYNLDVAIEARRLYPDDLEAQQRYIETNSFTGDDAWVWPSDSLLLEYFNERTGMRRAQAASQAFLGLMLLARLASAFDVAFFSPPQGGRVGLAPMPDRLGLQITYRF